jgi:hypothetical protein
VRGKGRRLSKKMSLGTGRLRMKKAERRWREEKRKNLRSVERRGRDE